MPDLTHVPAIRQKKVHFVRERKFQLKVLDDIFAQNRRTIENYIRTTRKPFTGFPYSIQLQMSVKTFRVRGDHPRRYVATQKRTTVLVKINLFLCRGKSYFSTVCNNQFKFRSWSVVSFTQTMLLLAWKKHPSSFCLPKSALEKCLATSCFQRNLE